MTTNEIEGYYNQGREQNRLTTGVGPLELARTQELLLRYLPNPPATILDVGGGVGRYAFWLADRGYTVHLIDIMPLHIEQALKASERQADHPLASARVGTAQRLDFPDSSADAVLLLGPLYHLLEQAERLQALREAYRVLKPNVVLFAVTISRFASFMDGLMRGFLADPYFAEIAARDLVDGQHRNPTGQRGYFTTAYFHSSTEIQQEVEAAGFIVEGAIAIEGMAGHMPDFDRFWGDDTLRQRLLEFLRKVEREPSILGVSAHLMTIGFKRERNADASS